MKQPTKGGGTIKRKKPSTNKKRKHKDYGTSKLELYFAKEYLDKLGLKYIYQFEAKDMKRFYESSLPNGTKFYISNQWGTQTDRFVEHVNNNIEGITVTKL